MDELTSLAFSIYSNKGVYAILLGSGISRSSGIPTGWDIVIDLINKLALQQGAVIEDAEKWFLDTFNESPDYSNILSKLVKTPTERVNLLKPYFEPTEEERENNLKEPTKAHRAIAQIAKNGYVKVILTTNFDRLLEKALEEVGITPQVICNVDDIDGAIPLVHADFTIIKINGDYLDCRFLNTKEELEDYPDKVKEYVLRVINEFGLITCGWSGKWDNGLRQIIRQSENRRFPAYFLYKKNCETELKELIDFRKGYALDIIDADSFFVELNERLTALAQINSNHPLNKEIAIARLKKYIVKPENLILFNDLLEDETKRVTNILSEFSAYSSVLNSKLFSEIIKMHDKATDIILPLTIHAVRWSKEEHYQIILNLLTQISTPPLISNFREDTKKTYYFSSLYLLYTVGIACIKYNHYKLLHHIFNIKISDQFTCGLDHLIKNANPSMFAPDEMNNLIETRWKTPLSTWLYAHLKNTFLDTFISSDAEYKSIFCIFEYLLSMNYLHIVKELPGYGTWVPWGQYQWQRYEFMRNENNLFITFFKDAEIQKDNWQPIKEGMFDNKYSTYTTIKTQVDDFLKTIPIR